jgi:NodT family efflux transporter outer membrane factor (OMF) lipoprotein
VEKRYLLLLPFSALALNGCSGINEQKPSDLNKISSYSSTRSLHADYQISWPDSDWWTKYHDPQLNQLITEALRDSPSIQVARARLKNAEGLAEQAGAVRSVQVGANISATEEKVSYQYKAYAAPENWNDYGSALLTFNYDFDFWGKNKATVAAATSELLASQAETAATRLMISSSIAQAYAELARLYANRDTAVSALDIRKKTVTLLNDRFQNGLETQGAVRQAESLRANADAELLGIDESIALQKNAIVALLGLGPDRSFSISRPGVNLHHQFGLPQDAGVNLLGHRPDVTAARWRAESAAKQIGVAKAQFYPDVSLSAFIGVQSFGLNDLNKSGNDAGSVGPAIYLPLFTGGRLSGQLTSAQARYDEAVASYNMTLTQALHDVADVSVSSRALNARLEKTAEAVHAAQDAYQIANNRYHGGLATYLDVLTAEDALVNSQRALANLQSRAFSLDIALIHALGGGYQASRS